MSRMLGEYQTSLLDENGRQQALESMVISRVMAQQARKELSKDQLVDIERRAADYKEKLLVNQYLKAHAKVEPVTTKMVEEYYAQHPEKYGARTIKRYEMVYTTKKIASNQRDSLFGMLDGAEKQTNWKVLTSKIQKKGMKVYYREGNTDDSVLDKNVKDLMKALKLKEASKATIIDGRLYLVRITKETQQTVRPLSEVSADIRKSLVPVKLKAAIKEVSEELMKSAEVEYFNQKNENK